jgi:hypothetical protein
MYKQSDYEAVMTRPESGWAKHGSAQNFDKTIRHLVNNQYIPSVVSLKRAIRELGIKRTDGKTSADDAREARAKAQANFDAVVLEAQRIPLTPEELNQFGSLSARDLSRRFFDENNDYFRIRYTMACQQFGFRPPLRFADEEQR